MANMRSFGGNKLFDAGVFFRGPDSTATTPMFWPDGTEAARRLSVQRKIALRDTQSKRKGLPTLPNDVPQSLRAFLVSIKEQLEVRDAQRGSPLDASPTFQDLINSGVIKVDGLSVAGREFTLDQVRNLISSTVPDWVNDMSMPPPASGVVVASLPAGVRVTWSAPNFAALGYTEVWRASANDLAQATRISAQANNELADALPAQNTYSYYWVRHVSKSGITGDFQSVSGVSWTDRPSLIQAGDLKITVTEGVIELEWPEPASLLDIKYYLIYQLDTEGDPIYPAIGRSNTNWYEYRPSQTGTFKFGVMPIAVGQTEPILPLSSEMTGAEISIIRQPAPTGFAVDVDGADLSLVWGAPVVPEGEYALPVTSYEIWRDAVDAGVLLATMSARSSRYRVPVDFSGAKTFLIRAIDSAGANGDAASDGVDISVPAAPVIVFQASGSTLSVSWNKPTASLPIREYEVGYTSGVFSWGTATILPRTSGLTALLFLSGHGTLNYSVRAYDSRAQSDGLSSSYAFTVLANAAPSVQTPTVIGTKLSLSWGAPGEINTATQAILPVVRYEIYDAETLLGTTAASVNNIRLPIQPEWVGANKTFTVYAVDTAGIKGAAGSVVYQIEAASAPVSIVTALATNGTVSVSWDQSVSAVPVQEYAIQYGASGVTWSDVGGNNEIRTGGTTATLGTLTQPGSYHVLVRAYTALGGVGAVGTGSLVITAPATPVFSDVSIVGEDVSIKWAASSGSFPIESYELQYGAPGFAWDMGTVLPNLTNTSAQIRVTWSGAKEFKIRARDINQNESGEGTVTHTIAVPSAPASMRTNVVDNNVLLYWGASPQGGSQLPVKSYELRRGSSASTWGSATSLGFKTGTFTTVFEATSGSYRYHLAAIDSAGNVGTAGSTLAAVSQPPDYILDANIEELIGGIVFDFTTSSGLQGFTSNAPIVADGDGLYIGNNLLTYSQEFDNASWTKAAILAFGSGSVANAIAAPDGTLTAEFVAVDSTTGFHALEQAITTVVGVSYAISMFLKAGTHPRYRIAGRVSGNWSVLPQGVFDLSTGTVVSSTGDRAATIESLPSGWYRCTIYGTCAVGTNTGITGGPVPSGQTSNSFDGATYPGGVYVWGAQLEAGAVATPYSKTTTAVIADQQLILATMPNMNPYDRQFFNGCEWQTVQVKLRRTGGTGSESGTGYARMMYARTDVNGANARSYDATNYYKQADVTLPAVADGWKVLTFDLSALTVGTTDWLVSRITGLRFDFGGSIGDAFEVDWIRILPFKLSNMVLENSTLYGPVSPTAAFETDFLANPSWTSVGYKETTAGFSHFLEKSGTAGYVEKIIDYGTTLPGMKVTASPVFSTVDGVVTTTPTISISNTSAVAGFTDNAGVQSLFATSFRWVKVRWDISASGNDDILALSAHSTKTDAKIKNDMGTANAVSTDSGGTVVSFNAAFVDVQSIVVTAAGTTAAYAIYDFVDTPNPTTFKVLLFNNSGTRISGLVSWAARGY